jgi:hypothetical protein
VRAIAGDLERDLPQDRTTRVDVRSSPESAFVALDLQGAVVYQLRRNGRDVVAPSMVPVLGTHYGSDDDPGHQVLQVGVDTPPPAGGEVIARVTVPQIVDPGDPFAPRNPPRRDVALTLIPAAEGR